MKIINKFSAKGGFASGEKNNSGQVMVEALVALSIIIVGVLSVFTLTTTSIGINRIGADRYVAINLAEEGVELVKNLLDRNIVDDLPWNNLPGFIAGGIKDYKIDYNDVELSAWGLDDFLFFGKDGGGYRYQEAGDTKTIFNRKITIDNVDSSHIAVTSTVYWQSKNVPYEFSAVDHFYDLKELKWNLNH